MQQDIFDYIKTCVTCQTIKIHRTGFSPAALNLGKEINLPFDNDLEPISVDSESRLSYKVDLENRLSNTYCLAWKLIEKTQSEQA